MADLRPSSQWIVPAGVSTGVVIRPLYLVESSPGVWELDDEGPAEGVLVETDSGVYELDDDETVTPDLRVLLQTGSGIAYHST